MASTQDQLVSVRYQMVLAQDQLVSVLYRCVSVQDSGIDPGPAGMAQDQLVLAPDRMVLAKDRQLKTSAFAYRVISQKSYLYER